MKHRPKTKKPKSSFLGLSGRRFTWLDGVVACSTIVLVGFGIWMTVRQHGARDAACKAVGATHEVAVKADVFSPDRIELNRCDTVRFVNLGAENYELAFGTHDNLVSYPGFTRQTLRPNEFFVLNAVQAGSYTIHDHIRAAAEIELDIREK